jgi:Ankyrin repeats (3 copies)
MFRHTAGAGRVEVCKYLIFEAGADVHKQDEDGWTALHAAAVNASAEICKILLDAGANVIEQNEEGNTPLHLTAKYAGNTDIDALKVLLENGADLTLTNKEGKTPLDVARGRGREYLEQLKADAEQSGIKRVWYNPEDEDAKPDDGIEEDEDEDEEDEEEYGDSEAQNRSEDSDDDDD